jgi:LexA-binding, inner membrane-associated putative hydrolase
MAGFKTHVTVSSLLGCGYAGVGYLHGMPPATAVLGGALCGFSGMLPDLDSDYGVPLRETMAFTAATVPMLLIHRFASLGLDHDQMVLLGVSLYLFIRFGVTNMIRKYTVHRGMFHSIPAGLTFAGVAFLLAGGDNVDVRYFKAGGVMIGFMSHLLLDEIYSVEWKGGRYRLKKSFGTAMKFWGDDAWANLSCYAKLAIVAVMILGEPSVMKKIQQSHPEFAQQYNELQGHFEGIGAWTNQATDTARQWADSFQQPGSASPQPPQPPPQPRSFSPRVFQAEADSPPSDFGFPQPPNSGAPPDADPPDPFHSPPAETGEATIRRDYDSTARPY